MPAVRRGPVRRTAARPRPAHYGRGAPQRNTGERPQPPAGLSAPPRPLSGADSACSPERFRNSGPSAPANHHLIIMCCAARQPAVKSGRAASRPEGRANSPPAANGRSRTEPLHRRRTLPTNRRLRRTELGPCRDVKTAIHARAVPQCTSAPRLRKSSAPFRAALSP